MSATASRAIGTAAFTAAAFAEYVASHGFGMPLPEAYDLGRSLVEAGDDMAEAAAEVCARGLTDDAESSFVGEDHLRYGEWHEEVLAHNTLLGLAEWLRHNRASAADAAG